MTVVLTGTSLTLEELLRVARGDERVELAPTAVERMRAARNLVEAALARGEQVYGFSTGVGMRKLFAIEDDQRLSTGCVRSHLTARFAAPADAVRDDAEARHSLAQGLRSVPRSRVPGRCPE
jgi:histidine ammonia-lyase